MKKRKMLANKETAMRLWASRYGKAQRVRDYAGRMMDRAAYGDRGSQYGWNLDHIFPQSKGGKTADHNLVCCHILTNDEKADKICFTANGLRFQVIKVENHYEIASLDDYGEIEFEPNFYDSAYGVQRFRELDEESDQMRFCAGVQVVLDGVETPVIYDFIREVFEDWDISLSHRQYALGLVRHVVLIRSMGVDPWKLVNDLLDKCVLLNTYLRHYFCPKGYISAYNIHCTLVEFSSCDDYYSRSDACPQASFSGHCSNTIFITSSVAAYLSRKNSTEYFAAIQINGGLHVPDSDHKPIEYSCIYTNLAKNLDKEVNKGD